MVDTAGTRRATNRTSWLITAVAVLASVVLVLVILGSGAGSRNEGADEGMAVGQASPEMREATVMSCRDLGIAGPAAWVHMPDAEFRAMLAEQVALGASRIRLSAEWKQIEWQNGIYDWRLLDQRVDASVQAGLEPLMLIHTWPDWLQGFSVVGSGAAQEFGEFAEAVAARYGDRVDAYEIWNEPNLERFWTNVNPDAYAELLAASSPRITAVDPGAEIVSGGLAPAANEPGYSMAGLDFLARVYELGANRYVTAIATHPYTFPESPSDGSHWNGFRQLDDYRRLMESYGDGHKLIWLTEYGAPTGGRGSVSEQEQADMAVEGLRMTVSDPRLGPIYLYTMYDLDLGADNWESHYGLMYGPGQPKPAYTAVQEAVGECTG